MIITAISDTHTLHNQITKDLPGGDLLLCAGDISSMGYLEEIKNFCKWAAKQDYEQTVFIAGNHDWGFQDYSKEAEKIAEDYGIVYLKDDLYLFNPSEDSIFDYSQQIKIYGSPWQPEFFNWAFNLPRNGEELKEKWDNIPADTDILITHGPPFGIHDIPAYPGATNVGCELLAERVKELKPKIHIFGHIHGGYGYQQIGDTHFINASVLNERYKYTHYPMTIDWDRETNHVKEFL